MKLKELSELLGLSPTTVSRALGGYPEVSQKTRRRVLQAAQQYGYTPNAHARSLATGTTSAIACVIPVSTRNEILNPIFADFLAGLGEACARTGFEISLKVIPDDQEEEAYRALRSSASVGGFILQSPRVDDPRFALLEELGLPFVVHGRSSNYDEPYSWLDVNNRRAITRCTQLLIDLGHRDIAFINGPEDLDFAFRRANGFAEALERAGIAPRADLKHSVQRMTALSGYELAGAMLDAENPPTAIICSSVVIGWGVQRALEERGLNMGADVSVAVFDDALDYLGNSTSIPLFTAVRSSVGSAGQRVAEMLIQQIRSGNRAPLTEIREAELVLGMSTGPVPSRVS